MYLDTSSLRLISSSSLNSFVTLLTIWISVRICLALFLPTPWMYCNENSIRLLFGISTPPTRTHWMVNLWTCNYFRIRIVFFIVNMRKFETLITLPFAWECWRQGEKLDWRSGRCWWLIANAPQALQAFVPFLLFFFSILSNCFCEKWSLHHSHILIVIPFQKQWFEFESPLTRFQFGLCIWTHFWSPLYLGP